MAKPKRHPLTQRWDPGAIGREQAAQHFSEWLGERLAMNDEEVTAAVLHLPGPVTCRCAPPCHHAAVELERKRIATEGVKPWR